MQQTPAALPFHFPKLSKSLRFLSAYPEILHHKKPRRREKKKKKKKKK
jgi:hypothetical protein